VTAVDAAGNETSGAISRVTIDTDSTNTVTVDWAAYSGAVSYNVYGRDDGSTTPEGLRLLLGGIVSPLSFTDDGTVAVTSSSQSPPLATVGVSLVLDLTPVDGKQRFVLVDDIVLRNSGRR
jgi:hypothetical protein